MLPEERLTRLDRWLHRTELSYYAFDERLNRKRRQEVGKAVDIRLHNVPRLSVGWLDGLGYPIKRSTYYTDVILPCGFWATIYYRQGYINSLSAYGIDFWCGRMTISQLRAMLDCLNTLIPYWHAEDEYIKQKWAKVEKLQTMRAAVRNARLLRSKQ